MMAQASESTLGAMIVTGILAPIVGALLWQLKRSSEERTNAEKERADGDDEFRLHLQAQIKTADDRDRAHLEVLGAIRDELKALSGKAGCQAVPCKYKTAGRAKPNG